MIFKIDQLYGGLNCAESYAQLLRMLTKNKESEKKITIL